VSSESFTTTLSGQTTTHNQQDSLTLNKILPNAETAVADISAGATIMVGGFGLSGIPENLINAVRDKGVRHLTVISNNAGLEGIGVGRWLENGQIRKIIGSYVGDNKLYEELVRKGQLEADLIPQGTMSECIRAGGAGIPAFYTPTGVGTVVADGKEVREFDGRTYILERALKADFALIKAYRGDRWGNLVYRKTTRNFSPMMATAARVTIVEVEEIVALGALDPEAVVTPGIYVDRIIQGSGYKKGIERRTVRKRSTN
jgi:3-oxoacid CoA-transferase subunit A